MSDFLRHLRRERSGVAATELALALPFLMTFSLWGIELANYAIMNMRVSQLAIQVADNASRIGDASSLGARRITETDINDLIQGANIQAGENFGLFDDGRVIISSLEVNSRGQQYIRWQRCMGSRRWTSSYGVSGQVLPQGMGPNGQKVFAFEGEAVMFVELAYDYRPLFSNWFVEKPTITAISSFTVRDDRDLTTIYQRNVNAPDSVAACTKFDNTTAAAG